MKKTDKIFIAGHNGIVGNSVLVNLKKKVSHYRERDLFLHIYTWVLQDF